MTSGCLATIAAAALFPSPASGEFFSPPPHKLPHKLKHQHQGKGLLPLQLQYQSPPPQKALQLQLQLQLQSGSSAVNPNHPVLIDVQDSRDDDSVLFSFGIAEQCSRHQEILSYLMSSSSSSCADFSHLMGFRPCIPSPCNYNYNHHHHDNLNMAHFLQTISPTSPLTVDPAGRVLFTGTPSEMRNLLSILAEFNLHPSMHPHPHPHTGASKVSLLVPYFDRTRGRAKAATKLSALNFPTETVAPSKCKGTNKSKSPQKKRQKKNTTYNRDMFQKNYFHACESLLSLLLDKSSTSTSAGRGTADAILSLKKLGPEIAHVLTSFSIGIAGTGLAVLFSVACKMPGPGTRVPLSATRFFNTGFGLGLFWLSWAVNGLRDTIVQLFKGSNKLKMKDEEMALKVERSMKGVLFRAGALVALAALRIA